MKLCCEFKLEICSYSLPTTNTDVNWNWRRGAESGALGVRRTKDEAEAMTPLHTKNGAHRQPVLDCHMAGIAPDRLGEMRDPPGGSWARLGKNNGV